MNWHHTDANMRAADAHYSAAWMPHDFTACCNCGCEWADEDNEHHDPHHVQSKDDPALCVFCFDTIEDEQ